ncbi:MAG: tetratricopeptide repeat protein [Spirochaetes bacterium]|jgi:TolA-binding protein|nr:tetratricopeptide repeat protein [Spirochaetota bacterium]
MKRLPLVPAIVLLSFTCLMAQGASQTEAIIRSILEGEVPAEKKEAAPKTPLPAEKKPVQPAQKDDKPGRGAQAPGPDEVLLKTGIQLYGARMNQAALVKFNELKSKYPESPFRDSAAIWAGKIHFSANRPAEAVREYASIAEDSGEYPMALYSIGEAYYKGGTIAGAIESFYKLSSQFPDHERSDDALLFLGNIYLNGGNGTQALETAINIIRYYPDRETVDDAYYLMAKVFEKDRTLKDMETARRVYRAFLKRANDEGSPHFRNSPLKARVERDLRYIESTYFKMGK